MIKKCLVCNKEFVVYPYQLKSGNGKFCSRKCSNNNPFFKSKVFINLMRKINKKYPHKFIKGQIAHNKGKKHLERDKHWNWKGGIYYDKDGYRSILVKDHPNANKYGYVLQHRLVVEKSLGRYLDKKEVVHHINHNRTDNRPENLYVFPNQFSHWRFHSQEKELKSNII